MAEKAKKKEDESVVASQSELKHTVRAGEKLNKIATDNHVTIGHLIALNELSTMVLEEGQVVYIQQ
ncbi:LysM peptidoglycan-binding domain-containing protein [Listeria grandensis]|uniref:LysM peptidoglycan-binding domain-containing protein n=1 Tax=Listeria grandensis TaxID=1494963 RepID=A0A7X0Y1U0_9LIST|nr:LysM peptidoglycan-binding domain-containing protein [Listeria grandensis]MBC1935163.1 LysM peptidoglycan-binding domain-containing protein [Listeria grandensis]